MLMLRLWEHLGKVVQSSDIVVPCSVEDELDVFRVAGAGPEGGQSGPSPA